MTIGLPFFHARFEGSAVHVQLPDSAIIAIHNMMRPTRFMQFSELSEPEIKDNGLLVEVKAVSANPVNWKTIIKV